MGNWYYRRQGKQFGPISLDEMRRLIRTDEVVDSDLVSEVGATGWKAAGEVEGLFLPPPFPSLPEWGYRSSSGQPLQRSGGQRTPPATMQQRAVSSGQPIVVPETRTPTPQAIYQCPKCHSEDIKSLRLVWEAGTAGTTTAGIGMAGTLSRHGETGLGVLVSKSTQQSLLGQKASPPPMKPVGCASFLAIIGLMMLIGSCCVLSGSLGELRTVPDEVQRLSAAAIPVGVVLLFVCVPFSIIAIVYNSKEYPKHMRRWERSYLCNRCGNIFECDF